MKNYSQMYDKFWSIKTLEFFIKHKPWNCEECIVCTYLMRKVDLRSFSFHEKLCKTNFSSQNFSEFSYRDPNVVALLWDIFILSWFDISEEDLRGRLEDVTSGVTGGAEKYFFSVKLKINSKKKSIKNFVKLKINCLQFFFSWNWKFEKTLAQTICSTGRPVEFLLDV